MPHKNMPEMSQAPSAAAAEPWRDIAILVPVRSGVRSNDPVRSRLSDLEGKTLRPPRKPIPLGAIAFAVRFVEFLTVLATGSCALLVLKDQLPPSGFAAYLNTVVLGATFSAIIFEWVGAYDVDVWYHRSESYRRLLWGWATTTAALLAFGFAFKIVTDEYSRLWGVSWFFATAGMLLVVRTVAFHQMKRLRAQGKFDVRVLICGAGPQGERLSAFIAESKTLTMRVIGFIDDRASRVPRVVNGLPVLGGMDELERLIRLDMVDQVILAMPWQAEERIYKIVAKVAMTPVKVRLAPDLIGYRYPNRSFRLLDGLPVLELFDRPISGVAHIVKGSEDQVAVLAAAIIFAPIIALIALAIKLDSRGPVFFRQDRIGFNNRVIRVWKFRTMRQDRCENEEIKQARRGDPRVTRVGVILRRTSLDELPQLFNVLSGEMSIVGPRPHAPSTKAAGRIFDQVVDSYASRHKVKPGITGWAQVNGWRGETDTEEKLIKRVEYDLYYIENWSVLFDMSIMLRTILTVFKAANAY
jgi:Undecaprenyl-phosphate glucose phosphotransferase